MGLLPNFSPNVSAYDFSVTIPEGEILEVKLFNSDGTAMGSTTSMNVAPSSLSSAGFNEKNVIVSVATSNEWGYNLVMNIPNTNLVSKEDSSNTIPTLTPKDGGYTCTIQTATTCDFTVNHWGYKINTNTNTQTASNYLPIPTTINLNKNSTVTTGDTTSISFGSRINASQAPGTYQSTITFAVTANPDPTPIMQNMTASTLATLLPSSGSTTTVKDERDGTKYTIGKLADGNYWMLDNLALDLTNSTVLNNVTTSNTNASATSLTSLKSGNRAAGDQYATAGLSNLSLGSNYSVPRVNADYKNASQTFAMGQTGTGKIGVYYNYCAATAGSYCYGNGADAGSLAAGNVTEDICPKGWRMPTGGLNKGEYKELKVRYGSDAAFVNAFRILLSGGFHGGVAYEQGESGRFWSMTTYTSYYAYDLYATTTSLKDDRYDGRHAGFSVRCVYDIPTMQSVNSAKLATLVPNNGDTITLPDERDGTEYTVGRLADGKVWMLDNLALDLTNSTTLNNTTASNTNASSASITSLKSGNRSAGNNYATAGVSNWTSSYSYSAPLVNATSKDVTQPLAMGQSGAGKIGIYYNYCAASAGSYCYGNGTSVGSSATGNASEDICPKGWRMPTGGSSGEYQALLTAYSNDKAAYVSALKTPLSGYFNLGSANNQGSYGYFWSSTYYVTVYMYFLDVYTSGVYPQQSHGRDSGASVRCLFNG